ncbi:MAG: penicillin-binding protein 2 [Opitutaceae bacterium]
MSVIESHRNHQPRLLFFYGLFGLMLVVLTVGLGYRQLIRSASYSERERLQNQRRVLVPGPRGNIYDREGTLLVGNRPRFAAVIFLSDPEIRMAFRSEYIRLVRDLRDREIPLAGRDLETEARVTVIQVYLDQLNRILNRGASIDSRKLNRHFAQQPLLPFTILDDLEPEEFALLVEQIPVESPIQVYSEPTRYYPYGSSAAHTLGYVVSGLDLPESDLPGKDLTTFISKGTFGRNGLEKAFDTLLQGETGGEIWIVDPAGFQVERIRRELPVQGNPLTTSLDIDLQTVGENAFGDRQGALVALDVHTGEVLAMVSKPDYDLNDLTPFISREVFARINDEGAWLNRAAQGLYPPGSIFKVLTAIAGIRAGVINENSTALCTGYLRVGGRNFPCHNRRGHGEVNLSDALRVSCNVFFYKYGLETGIDNISAEARRFGLDQQTGIEIPSEATAMIVPSREWKKEHQNMPWFPGDTANTSIGQGFFRVTPLQMACVAASLARNQTRTTPTLLRTLPESVRSVPASQPIGIDPRLYAMVIDGMEQAAQIGTARLAKIPGIRMAAKTGTAQVRTPEGTLELAWFMAFAPIENPEIAIALVVVGEEPDESNGGGLIAGPVAKQVLQRYFEKHPQPGTLQLAGSR